MRILEPLDRDYEILAPLAETSQSRVFLGKRRQDGQDVVIKTLQAVTTKPEEVFRLRREYGMLRELSMEGVIKIYDLREMEGIPALVLERFEGVTLQKYMEKYPKGLPLKLFFPIGLHVVSTLAEVHKRGILHLDLKPSNILISSKRVCLTDFGISRMMGTATGNILEGSLPYMSPEQTGRTSFAVDQRSDLYSLGVVFYEMIFGYRPFEAKDLAGWVHAHLAEKPKQNEELAGRYSGLVAIIMKLLEKDPGKRYQSSYGLLYDLHKAYQYYQKAEKIPEFVLGERDFPQKLQFSRKLYGREKEKEVLEEGLRRSVLGSLQHLVLVGEKGIGKTLLLDTVWTASQEREMWRVRVTFSQDRQSTPYHGLRQFLYDIVQQMYTLPVSEQKVLQEGWERIADQGKVLSALFPEMEKVFPSRGEVEVLDPEAAQKRLFYVFVEFLRVLVSRKRPLWLVLDHIQWADGESRSLFLYLVRQSLAYVYVVTVFQGKRNEWEEWARWYEGTSYRLVEMEGWTREDLKSCLSDLFAEKTERLEGLAGILFDKTHGNPLQCVFLLQELEKEGLLFLDGYRGWKWKEEAIAAYHPVPTEKTIHEMLGELDEDSRRILGLASCIGNRFTLQMIQEVVGTSEEEILALLVPLMEKRLVNIQSGMVVWSHNILREAVYAALEEKERTSAHYLVGMYFLQQGMEAYEDKVYFVLDHVLKGLACIDPHEEGEMVLSLVMKVAEQNKQSGAFSASYESLSQVRFLVSQTGEGEWFLRFYEAYAESAYYTAHYNELEEVLEVLKKAGYDEMVCFDLWILFMKALGSQEKYERATEVFFHLASLLSLPVPRRISIGRVLPLLGEVLWKLRALSDKKLQEMPVNQDPLAGKQAKLLFSFAPLAFFTSPFLNVFMNLFGVKLSLRKGLFPETPFFLIASGAILSGLGQKRLGNQVADKGIYLMEKMEYTTNAAGNYFVYYSFLFSWVHSQHEMPERLTRVYERAVVQGDVEYAAYALMVMSLQQWQVGSSLAVGWEYIRNNVQTIQGLGQRSQEIVTRLCLQMVENVVKPSEDPSQLEGEWYRESEMRALHEREKDYFALRYLLLYKLIIAYVFEKYETAYFLGKSIVPFEATTKSTAAYVLYLLFMGLIGSKLAIVSAGKHRQEFIKWLQRAEKMYGKWVKLSSENYAPGYYLLRAEKFRVLRRPWEALHWYGKAIEAAHQNGYRLYEAIAFERRADYWESQGEHDLAEQDRRQAFRVYKRWGAEAKTHHMVKQYPMLGAKVSPHDETTTHHTLTATGTQTVDLVTMVKASEALMGETDVNALLRQILTMVVENAGAEKGVFLYEKDECLMVRAIKNPSCEAEVVSLPFEEYTDMPQRVIQYALQKDEELVVEDAQEESLFVSDPYIMNQMVRSLLVIPVYRVGRRVGLVYLENNMGRGMFTRERIGTLRILLAQASIALQNVDLLNRVKDATRLETEMHLAKDMQIGLLPKKPYLPGYEVVGFMKTADEVGGDYYDVIGETSPGWVMIGDVSGHGFSSGQVMAMTQTALQVLVRENPLRLPTELLQFANRAITYNIGNIFYEDFKYVTITVLQVWEDGRILYAGQHQDIWVFRQATGEVEVFSTDGLWLGIDNLLGREETNKQCFLEKGDVMLLYTDGLTEARQNGELVGEKAKDIFQQWGRETLETIQRELVGFINQCEVRDDVTFVLIRKQ
ncbi:MAG: SpoIIE family protein phosphatase [Brevinematales bacterium]|nr:SpoIIE family protein phosphatase [Brevinematales bacterium]